MLQPVETQQPICIGCVHLRPTVDFPPTPRCAAFPNGIPEAIWLDGYDHREAFAGDNGVRFQLGDSPRQVAAMRGYEASLT